MLKHSAALTFRFTPEIRARLEAIRERDGASYAEQIRRALELWFAAKLPEGVPRPDRKRPLKQRTVG